MWRATKRSSTDWQLIDFTSIHQTYILRPTVKRSYTCWSKLILTGVRPTIAGTWYSTDTSLLFLQTAFRTTKLFTSTNYSCEFDLMFLSANRFWGSCLLMTGLCVPSNRRHPVDHKNYNNCFIIIRLLSQYYTNGIINVQQVTKK